MGNQSVQFEVCEITHLCPKCVILPHYAYFSYLHRWRNLFAAAAEYVIIINHFCPVSKDTTCPN